MKKQESQEIQTNQEKAIYQKPELTALGDIRDVTMGGSIGLPDSGGGGPEAPLSGG